MYKTVREIYVDMFSITQDLFVDRILYPVNKEFIQRTVQVQNKMNDCFIIYSVTILK